MKSQDVNRRTLIGTALQARIKGLVKVPFCYSVSVQFSLRVLKLLQVLFRVSINSYSVSAVPSLGHMTAVNEIRKESFDRQCTFVLLHFYYYRLLYASAFSRFLFTFYLFWSGFFWFVWLRIFFAVVYAKVVKYVGFEYDPVFVYMDSSWKFEQTTLIAYFCFYANVLGVLT